MPVSETLCALISCLLSTSDTGKLQSVWKKGTIRAKSGIECFVVGNSLQEDIKS